MGKQKIKCDVESCKYNDCKDGECTLDTVKVGCDCANDDCKCSADTVCQSFCEDDSCCDDESDE